MRRSGQVDGVAASVQASPGTDVALTGDDSGGAFIDGGPRHRTHGLPRVKAASLVQRVREVLVEAILDGRFPDGRFPSEPDLAKQLGTSRTTLRDALKELQALGLLERTPGAGTVLLDHTGTKVLGLSGLISFSRLLAARGRSVAAECSLEHDADIPPEVVKRLDLAPAEPVSTFRVVLYADSVPSIASHARFRASEARDHHVEEPLPPSILDISAQYFRDPIDHAVAEIVPVISPEDHFQRLDVQRGMPLLLLRETHYTATHRPVATSDVFVDPRQQLLSVFRRVPSAAGYARRPEPAPAIRADSADPIHQRST